MEAKTVEAKFWFEVRAINDGALRPDIDLDLFSGVDCWISYSPDKSKACISVLDAPGEKIQILRDKCKEIGAAKWL